MDSRIHSKLTTSLADGGTPLAPRTVKQCYEITNLSLHVGIEDYTEGIYTGNQSLEHETAQRNQHDYILNELGARQGYSLLDVGCGNGTLLETARERGVNAVGITISQPQFHRCRSKGLDVHLANYKFLPKEWFGRFDGVVANGSLEHFVQPEDALHGRQDSIYQDMFKTFHSLLKPDLSSGKVVTTAVHFRDRHRDPANFLGNTLMQIFDRDALHFNILHRGYGGYYPVGGQLERCAKGHFKLENEVEATRDYEITADYWTGAFKKAIVSNVEFVKDWFGFLMRSPKHTLFFTASFVGLESWAWQFRGEDPPTRLYRHTWSRS